MKHKMQFLRRFKTLSEAVAFERAAFAVDPQLLPDYVQRTRAGKAKGTDADRTYEWLTAQAKLAGR